MQSTISHRLLITVFSVNLLLSASLLFFMEPMIGKMLLPLLGGSASVWNVCLVFFQLCLLLGYAYAHFVTQRCTLSVQVSLHLLLMLAALIYLPLVFNQNVNFESPGVWLFTRLFVGAGLPFFVLATMAPLLQKWFSLLNHPDAEDPYFLYAASNAGSLLALLSYPFIAEPLFDLGEQNQILTFGYYLLCTLFVVVLYFLFTNRKASAPSLTIPMEFSSLKDYLYWTLLAFIPSALMVSTTFDITSATASLPLLWVVPLALYLLTYIFAFSRHNWFKISEWYDVYIVLFIAILAYGLASTSASDNWILLVITLIAFFVASLIIHSFLARSRPKTPLLTHYYLAIAVGGALGGSFSSFIAPAIFNDLYEFFLLFILVYWCIASAHTDQQHRINAMLKSFALFIGVCVLVWLSQTHAAVFLLIAATPLFYWFVQSKNNYRVYFVSAFCVLLTGVLVVLDNPTSYSLHKSRNFFGIKEVLFRSDSNSHLLLHNGTIHGLQLLSAPYSLHPSSYYAKEGPAGEIFAIANELEAIQSLAIIGLGVGTLSSYRQQNQHFDIFEIDPDVIRIAQDPSLFSYLSHCGTHCTLHLGDARVKLGEKPSDHYDLLIVDAFSGHTIPRHLLTLDALKLYLNKIKPSGLLVIHVSSPFYNLYPLIGSMAASLGVNAYYRSHSPTRHEADVQGVKSSHYVALTHNPAYVRRLDEALYWNPLKAPEQPIIWTDDHSSLINVMRWW